MNASLTLKNGPVLIVGLGMTGLSCARFLAKHHIAFDLADSRDGLANRSQIEREFPEAALHLGEFCADVLKQYATLVVSPGIALATPALQAVASSCDIIGDIELFARVCNKPVVAITGSNGKSTVTLWTQTLLKAAGSNAVVGGNIGTPALDVLSGDFDVAVLELSSFQLETTQSLHPDVAVVLNLSADHMDRYDHFDDYANAKLRIFNQANAALVNLDDTELLERIHGLALPCPLTDFSCDADALFACQCVDGREAIVYAGRPLVYTDELALCGRHNVANALAALALCHVLGVDVTSQSVLDALRTFSGLPHRCQRVDVASSVRYFNDSKGTNVGSTLAAILGFAGDDGRLLLILGGVGKGQDFSELSSVCADQVDAVYAFGRDAQLIASAINHPHCEVFERLEQVLEQVQCDANAGDTVLFSPACASFDQYDNFEHRGVEFTRLVKQAMQEQGGAHE